MNSDGPNQLCDILLSYIVIVVAYVSQCFKSLNICIEIHPLQYRTPNIINIRLNNDYYLKVASLVVVLYVSLEVE